MATQMFLRTARRALTPSVITLVGGGSAYTDEWVLDTTRSAGGTDSRSGSTVAGPTSGVELGSSLQSDRFASLPLAAAVTISGTITVNLWASESNMSANVAINCAVYKISPNGTRTLVGKSARTTEVAVTTRAVNNFTFTPTSTAFAIGDRIEVVPYADDAGTMGSGFTFSVSWNGSTPGADGDSYVTFTENLSFVSESPSGTQVFLRNTGAGINPGAASELEMWTSRGASAVTATTTLSAGPTSGVQITDTAGGTPLEWYSRTLQAVTIEGGALVKLRAWRNAAGVTTGPSIELAVVDSDGTNPTVIATNQGVPGSANYGVTTSGADGENISAVISFATVSISQGQRLRLRIFADDPAMDSSGSPNTLSISYDGPTANAAGDSYIQFVQTLTEFVAGTTETPTPGGASAGGSGPIARVLGVVGGVLSAGRSPSPTIPLPQGGVLANGLTPAPRVVVSSGGVVVSGVAPTVPGGPVVETPTPGGAVAGGVTPLARATVNIGGAVSGGSAPSCRASTSSGGVVVFGTQPTSRASATPGGVGVSGNTPTARSSPTPGGAVVSGTTPLPRTSPTPGGAVVSGNAPVTRASATPGGAIVSGNAPSARVTSATGGATCSGTPPSARVGVTPSGALVSGLGASALVLVSTGGALVGGNSPADGLPTIETPAPGGAQVRGNAPTPHVSVVAAGSFVGGRSPTLARASASAGGALVGGQPVSASQTASVGGGVVTGIGPVAVVLVSRGQVLVGGNEPGEPTLIKVVDHFDPPSPGGGHDAGSPTAPIVTSGSTAGMFDSPSPSVG